MGLIFLMNVLDPNNNNVSVIFLITAIIMLLVDIIILKRDLNQTNTLLLRVIEKLDKDVEK